MKLEKLAVSLAVVAAMSAFNANSATGDPDVGMRNTDANASSVSERDVMSAQPSSSDPSTPQTGSSSSIDSQSSGGFTGGSEMAWPVPIEPNSVTTLPDSSASSGASSSNSELPNDPRSND